MTRGSLNEPPDCCRWHAFSDVRALQQAACKAILASGNQAIEERGKFHLVLAGGSTPLEIYRELRTARTDWSKWHIYFSDERCLPPCDPVRNSNMAAKGFLDFAPIPRSQINTIPAELGALEAAKAYGTTLKSVGYFDLVLLGLGEDGHTASLFPDHEWGTTSGSADTLAVFDAPKPPPQRVSLSAARMSRAGQVLFLVTGEAKRRAVAMWRGGANIPARAIRPPAGVDVLVESSLLENTSRPWPR